MSAEEVEKARKAVAFLKSIEGTRDASLNGRAILWDSAYRHHAKGLVFAEPSLDQPQSGFFEPDDATQLDNLKASARYLSIRWPQMCPVEMMEIRQGPPEPCIHFVVNGPPVDYPVKAAD